MAKRDRIPVLTLNKFQRAVANATAVEISYTFDQRPYSLSVGLGDIVCSERDKFAFSVPTATGEIPFNYTNGTTQRVHFIDGKVHGLSSPEGDQADYEKFSKQIHGGDANMTLMQFGFRTGTFIRGLDSIRGNDSLFGFYLAVGSGEQSTVSGHGIVLEAGSRETRIVLVNFDVIFTKEERPKTLVRNGAPSPYLLDKILKH